MGDLFLLHEFNIYGMLNIANQTSESTYGYFKF